MALVGQKARSRDISQQGTGNVREMPRLNDLFFDH